MKMGFGNNIKTIYYHRRMNFLSLMLLAVCNTTKLTLNVKKNKCFALNYFVFKKEKNFRIYKKQSLSQI